MALKKTIYMSFDVYADSYQEARQKLESICKHLEYNAPILSGVPQIISTRKFVDKVKL